MREIIRKVKGVVVGRGEIAYTGYYSIYSYLEFKDNEGNVEKVENIAMNTNQMESVLGQGACFQFADATKLNHIYKYNYLVGMQKLNGDVLVDDRILRYPYKTRRVLAFLSLIPPFTVIAPLVFNSAKKIKAAYDEVGQFDPLEPNFISKNRKKKF
ncbi:hypothetical protein [Ralstonia pseudosolanacearum]